ncbi:MAG: pilin [Spongiibacteraceae bacterium]
MRAKSACQAFTLIEMLVVLAIIAILAMIAMPNTQDRFIRAQIVEAVPLADIAKTPIAAAWLSTHTLPADNPSIGLPAPQKVVNQFISAVEVEQGAVHITFGNRANGLINGKVLTLRPAVVADAPVVPVTWVCGGASAPAPMTINGTNKTTVPDRFLPLNCRP